MDPDCPHKDNYHVYTEVDFSKNKIKLFYSENYIFLNQFNIFNNYGIQDNSIFRLSFFMLKRFILFTNF